MILPPLVFPGQIKGTVFRKKHGRRHRHVGHGEEEHHDGRHLDGLGADLIKHFLSSLLTLRLVCTIKHNGPNVIKLFCPSFTDFRNKL